MRCSTVFLFLFVPYLTLSAAVTSFIPKEAEPLKIDSTGFGCVFVTKFQSFENLDRLKTELEESNIVYNVVDRFQILKDRAVRKYCSEKVSPYLLSEILSQLSIYKQCLKNGSQTALILKQDATVKHNPTEILEIVGELEKIDQSWDVFYPDVDFHNSNTGEFVVPNLTEVPTNKVSLHPKFSKIHYRYGSTALFVSRSGMRKILSFFERNWPDVPFDQALYLVPGLRIYGANSEIITNHYNERPAQGQVFAEPKYSGGKELWMSPNNLLTYDRFDVMAKYIYAKYFLNQYDTNWHVDLYRQHLRKWVQCYNTEPLKRGFKDFSSAFDRLLVSVQKNQFDERHAIPINTLGLATNGSHRIGASLALNLPVKVKVQSGAVSPGMSAQVFQEKYQLEEKYLDHMAYECTKLKPRATIVTLYDLDRAIELESLLGNTFYKKKILFSEEGIERYTRISAPLHEVEGLKGREILVYLCDGETKQNLIEKVLEMRLGQHVAITHSHDEAKLVAKTVFNSNSIDFLNRKKEGNFTQFTNYFEKLKSYIHKHQLDPELLCVDTGSVLSVYGLRDCNDMDIIHKEPLPGNYKAYEIDSHNPHLHHHSVCLDEILFNPECHFYYEGVKFVAPELVREMKADRGAEKDLRDIALLETVL